MKLVFIPKSHKEGPYRAKNFRPITLSSFLLKGLERLVQWLLFKTIPLPLHKQHAFTPNFSTDSALSSVLNIIESSLASNHFAYGVLMDISGAFDRVSFDAIKKSMSDQNLPHDITNWYCNLLNYRFVKAESKGCKVFCSPTAGTPQGGVLSPLIWNLVLNSFLTSNINPHVQKIGFADDIILLTRGS